MKKLLFPIKILVILCAAILPIHLIPSQKGQTAYAITSQVFVTAPDLNVRENADITSKIIEKVHRGDKFEMVGSKKGWIQLRLPDSQTGWVYHSYVTPDEHINAIVEASVLNVRESPSLSGSIKAKLTSGTKITVQEEHEGWAKIESASGVNGWVYENYISKDRTASGEGVPMPKVQPTKTDSAAATSNSSTQQSSAGSTDSKHTSVSHGSLNGKTIVLDPGHGGYDDGTTSITGTHEKALTLATAKTVEKKLVNAGANVIMTRTGDTYIPLQQRANLSDQNHADAFISFHYNWSNDPSVNGLTDFYYQKTKDDPLAADILNDVVKTTRLNIDGTRFDNLDVLRNNTQPSTLIELGFLSNKQDDSLVESSSYRDEVAQGVYLGLLDYFSGQK